MSMAGLVDKLNKLWHPSEEEFDDYYDEEDYEEEEIEEVPPERKNSYKEEPAKQAGPSLFRKSANVVNFSGSKSQLKINVYKPLSFGKDTREMAETFLNGDAMVLNFEQTNNEETKRILDFLSGVAFAQSGNIKKISVKTFIITPPNVEISGSELFDEFENNGVYF